ncbi:unnamed protein product [Didymodactylos carnosus]|uniref:Uncharacterized protein n=2 Tax=Didymodactylos carnosus TaxID=1234261 RepID=A0A814EKJ5_9BILA|nr:unnamed protein product [Didymodactylos carnosus]CAF3745452.1 unnamed protein product [Didymodactylos carnosus]
MFNDASHVGTVGLTYPIRIVVKANFYIPCTIQFFYKSSSGGIIQGPEHGRVYDNCKAHTFELESQDRITGVEVRTHLFKERYWVIHYIKFTTNTGKEMSYGLRVNTNDSRVKLYTERYKGFHLSYISGFKRDELLTGIQFHWITSDVQYVSTQIKYQLDHAIASAGLQPQSIIRHDVTNCADVQQEVSAELETKAFTSKSWEINVGLTVGTEIKFSAGIPVIATNQVTVRAETSFSYKYGQTETKEETVKRTLKTNVAPKSYQTATMVVIAGTIEVPYTTHLKVVYADGTIVEQSGVGGVYKGVNVIDSKVTYSPTCPLDWAFGHHPERPQQYAQVGFDSGDGKRFYVLPKSYTSQISSIINDSNVNVPGQFIFDTAGQIANADCNTKEGLLTTPFRGSIFDGYDVRVHGVGFTETTYKVMIEEQTIDFCEVASVYITCIMPMLLNAGKNTVKAFDSNSKLSGTTEFISLKPEEYLELILVNSAELDKPIDR